MPRVQPVDGFDLVQGLLVLPLPEERAGLLQTACDLGFPDRSPLLDLLLRPCLFLQTTLELGDFSLLLLGQTLGFLLPPLVFLPGRVDRLLEIPCRLVGRIQSEDLGNLLERFVKLCLGNTLLGPVEVGADLLLLR